MTSGGDDIEKLLRELDAFEAGPSGGASVPAKRPPGAASPTPRSDADRKPEKEGGPGGRMAFALLAAVVVGLLGAFVGMFLGPVLNFVPFLESGFWSTGLGAAFGAFITALIGGPPRWFSG